MVRFRDFLKIVAEAEANEDALAVNNVGGGQIAGFSPVLQAMVKRKKANAKHRR